MEGSLGGRASADVGKEDGGSGSGGEGGEGSDKWCRRLRGLFDVCVRCRAD